MPVGYSVERCTSRAFLGFFCHLLSFLCRLVKCSRHERPGGSLPTFACGDIATTIPPITGGPSLFPPSFTRYLIGVPCDYLPRTEDSGLTMFHIDNRLGEAFSIRRWRFLSTRGPA